MKVIQQATVFNPISIVLESREERDMFWDIIDFTYKKYPIDSKERLLLVEISNILTEL